MHTTPPAPSSPIISAVAGEARGYPAPPLPILPRPCSLVADGQPPWPPSDLRARLLAGESLTVRVAWRAPAKVVGRLVLRAPVAVTGGGA